MKIVWKRKEKAKPIDFLEEDFYKDGASDIALSVLMLLFILIIVLLIYYGNHILSH